MYIKIFTSLFFLLAVTSCHKTAETDELTRLKGEEKSLLRRAHMIEDAGYHKDPQSLRRGYDAACELRAKARFIHLQIEELEQKDEQDSTDE